MRRTQRVARAIRYAVALATVATPTGAQQGGAPWVSTWKAAPQLVEPRNMPPAPGLSGSTLRQFIHVTIGGPRLRLRVSNEFGDGPLVVSATHIARAAAAAPANGEIDSTSDSPLRFGGQSSITLAPGTAVTSDPIEFAIAPSSDLAITLDVERAPAALTGHPGSRTTSFIATGDHVRDAQMAGAATTEHWYLIDRVDVDAPAGAAAVVVLGNSIADGRGSGTNKNDRWPDNLARRLAADSRTAHVAVDNAGIGGNAILRGGLGPTALAREQRDVREIPGAHWVIISEGVNDVGASRSADIGPQLLAAYDTLIARAHDAGLKVYVATMLPFAGSQYGGVEHEQSRQTINAWIRAGRGFDGVIDFDAVMRDPTDSSRLRADLDSGDHLHPNEAGYEAMARAIDLGLFDKR